MISYKLVDADGYSRRGDTSETLWLPIGSTVKPTGEGTEPWGEGVLHAYATPEIGALMNPIHAVPKPGFRCLEIETEVWQSDGTKRWTVGDCTVLGEVEVPEISTEERVAWAICLAPHPTTRDWAVGWLSGRDRSVEAAREARKEREAWAVRAAAWAAMRAAEREDAEADAWAADVAVRTAEVAADPFAFEHRLMACLVRARAILAGEFPAERYDDEYPVEEVLT